MMKLSKTIGIVTLITVLSLLLVALPGCKKAADHPTGEHPAGEHPTKEKPAEEKPAEPKPSSEPPITEHPNEGLLFGEHPGDVYITEWNLAYEDPNDEHPESPDHPDHPEHPGIE
jgi:hypothetical protein